MPGGRGGTPGFVSIVPACEPPETKFMVEVVSGTPTRRSNFCKVPHTALLPSLDKYAEKYHRALLLLLDGGTAAFLNAPKAASTAHDRPTLAACLGVGMRAAYTARLPIEPSGPESLTSCPSAEMDAASLPRESISPSGR